MRVDFHMHSTFSDGVETPAELMAHAIEQDLSIIALTDHDEIEGIHIVQSIDSPVKVITGCEFSGHYKGKDIHILGYDFDCHHPKLKEFIEFFKEKRLSRIKEIISRCNKEGYHICFEDLATEFPDTKAYGRPHVAKLLVDGGYAKDIQEVFSNILCAKSPCYVPKVKIDVPHILHIIHDAGGYAVLAHPVLIRNDEYVKELLSYDFDGVEIYHSKHSIEDVERYKAMAKERGLFVTGGSDYHGNGLRFPFYLGEFVVNSEDVNEFVTLIDKVK